MRTLEIRRALSCFTGLTAMALTSAANAATGGQAPAANPASEVTQAEGVSDEYAIIVTARRKEENLQDVPVAISVLGGEALERENIVDAADLGGAVPGLIVGNSVGGGRSSPTFAIRGQSQQELSGIADPSVPLYVNDIAVPRSQGSNTAFFDLAGIEVAKGPQGTLFGRNTTGGAIIIRTHRPENDFSAYVSPMAGNFGMFGLDAMINVPLGDFGAVRVAGQHYERDGYLRDVLLDKKINSINEDAVRISLLLEPVDGLKNDTTFQYTNSDNGGTGGYIVFSLNPLFQAGLTARQNLGFRETESGLPMFARVDTYHVDNTTTYEVTPEITMKNIFGYRDMKLHSVDDFDGSANILFPVERIVEQHQVSNEVQLQGDFDRFDFILGAYYFRENGSDQALTTGALSSISVPDAVIEPPSILDYDPRYSNTFVGYTNTSHAIFLQGNYEILDGLSATAGIRQNWDKREANIMSRGFIGAVSTTSLSCRFTLDEDGNSTTPETRPSLANCLFSDQKKFDELTYNLSLQYQLNDRIMAYAAHRHGYRSGGFGARGNSQATLSDTFEPEIVDDVEIGLKADWRFGDSFLRTNVAAYRANYNDMQRVLILSPPGVTPTTLTTNAGKARVQGIEFEGIFRPSPLFELSGFYTYTDAGFRKYIGPNGDDLSGQVFSRAPKHTFSVTAAVMPPLPEGKGDLRFSLTYRYQAKYDYNDDYALEQTLAGTPLPAGVQYNLAQTIDAQKLLGANIEWISIMGSNFDASIFAENLANRKYLLPYFGISGVFEARTPATPRTVGVRLRARF